MEPLNFLENIIDWLFKPRYNCNKGKHRWGYILSDGGNVFLDDEKVPKDMWECLDCGVKKF